MKTVDVIAAILVIVGGINWGLVGFFGFDLVAAVLKEMSPLSRIIYALVGLAALYELIFWSAIRRRWHAAKSA
jgi:uncharacterized membrane protein YuzA (DUF378 family)